MTYNITRRDFLNGMAIATGTGLLTPTELFAQTSTGGQHVVYPPTLTGMRGNHAGSFETMHALAWAGQKPEAHHKLGLAMLPAFVPLRRSKLYIGIARVKLINKTE
ncbi:twin-arginine translocation signal domain-containing protein [Gammaproteobacteria bacterium]|mgnify:CR=1 FL=1|nr:twin-arginine translocation signal domain-containing protein [Gammaproteobacteria bacterium]